MVVNGSITRMKILDEEEQEVMDAIAAAYTKILGLRLGANHHELVASVHVLQGFVVQHALHRLDPEHWNAWYEKGGEP